MWNAQETKNIIHECVWGVCVCVCVIFLNTMCYLTDILFMLEE